MPGEILDSVREWNKQKTNVFNQSTSKALDTFETQSDTTFSDDGKQEFKHAVSIPKAEIAKCANQFLKYRANNCQNQLAAKPEDSVCNKAFLNSQIEYRDWRGKEMSEGLKDTEVLQGMNFDSEELKPVKNALYRVEFFTKKSLEDEGRDPAVAYTTYKDVKIDNLQAADILEIIKGAEIDDQAAQFHDEYYDNPFTKSIVDSLIEGLDKVWGFAAVKSKVYNEGFFTQIGAEAKTDARYAFKTGKKTGFTADGKIHQFKFDINKFIPTKSKIYMNPKVVQKMTLDILNSPFPAMHADLSIDYLSDENQTLNWTIHKVYQDHHTAIHLTYISGDEGLSHLPDTLPGIRAKYPQKIKDCASNRALIDAKIFTKRDDMSMTALHCHQAKYALNEMAYYGLTAYEADKRMNFGQYGATNESSCGFIYEYWPDYTVIASTIIKPFESHSFNCTSYTIIHWNSETRHKKKERGPPNHDGNDRLKTVEDVMNRLQVRVEGLDTGYNQLLPMQQFRLEVKDNHPLGYFIPGILELEYAKSGSHVRTEEMGGYLIKSLNFQVKLVLEHHRHKLELELLTQHILPYFGRHHESAFRDLSDLVLNTFAEKLGNGKTKYIPVYPGFLGYMLEKIHKNPEHYDAERLIAPIKQWTLDWHEFLTSRGIVYLKRNSNSPDLIKLVAEIEDRNTVRRALEKKNKQGATPPGHPKALPRPTQQRQASHPWTAKNMKNGNTQRGKENLQEDGAAGRNANAMSDMGLHSGLMGSDSRESQVHEWGAAADETYAPRNRGVRDKTQDSRGYQTSIHTAYPQAGFSSLKMQAEIDTLKRTLNELTLKAALPI